MSDFAILWGGAQAAFDAAFGERIEIHHVVPRRGNQVGVPSNDPAFPPFVVPGILKLAEQVAVVKGARLNAAESDITVEQSTASFTLTLFDDAHPPPRQYTRLVALDRPPAVVGGAPQPPSFVVDAPPKPDGLSRIVCALRD